MPPVLDRENYQLLIKEKKDFIVCIHGNKKEDLFKDIFGRYASNILVLVCRSEKYPELVRSLKIITLPAILFFSEGRLMDKLTDLENKEKVFERIEGFIRYRSFRDKFLLEKAVFQRNSKRIKEFLEELYHKEVGYG